MSEPAADANPSKMAFAMELATGASITDAHTALDIPRTTAFRWAKAPEVRAEVDAVRADVRRQIVQRLVNECSTALDALHDVLTTGKSEQAKVLAARTVLEETRHHVEVTELADRIAELEHATQAPSDRRAVVAELRSLMLIEGDGVTDEPRS